MNEKKKLQPKVRFREFTGENAPDWEQRKLGELSEIVRGASPRPIQDPKWFDESSDIGWLRISDVTNQNGRVHFLEQKISKLAQEKTRVLETPHLLLSIAASVGKPVINYTKTGVHDGFLIFINPKFDLYFMFQWLEMFKPIWQKYGQPGSQVNLNSDIVKNHKINIPSDHEQEHIGQFFEKIDKLITLHQRKLEQLEQLKNTLLSKMFPKSGTNIPEIRFSGFTDAWKQRKLGEVVIRLDNLRIPITESNRVSGPTPYYGANGIQDYVEGYTHDGEYILIAEDGANDTNNYPIFRVHGKIWVNNHAHVLQTIDDIADNDYVAYALKSINIGPYLVGGSRSKLNADSLMKLEIKLPKLSEQIKVGQIFVKIDYQIKNYKQKLKNLKTIKKSLLNKLFI